MADGRMDKAAGNKGSNNVSNRAGFTQNISEEAISVSRLKSADSISMMVPGGGNVTTASGAVKEGSARKCAEAMSFLVGSAGETQDEPSMGNNG